MSTKGLIIIFVCVALIVIIGVSFVAVFFFITPQSAPVPAGPNQTTEGQHPSADPLSELPEN